MLTTPLKKNFYYYHSIGSQVISGLTKKVISGDNYFGRKTYYNAILNQYSNFYSYLNILNDTIELNSIPSSIDIQPFILGADVKMVLSKFGKPVFIYNENKVTIFIYKWKFNELKTRCEVHFYNKIAFLVSYNYSQLKNHEKSYVIKAITRKYTGTDGEIDIMNCKIIDDKNNMVSVDDHLEGLKITYLSGKESDWYKQMFTEIEKKKEKLSNRTRLAEQLFYNKI